MPTLTNSFDQMAVTLDRIEAGQVRELLFLGVVGTFAVGWLLPRLLDFQQQHPFIDVRISTNNNRVDMAAEGLDFAIRFGSGSWHGTEALRLFDAPLSPLCIPKLADRLRSPADLVEATLCGATGRTSGVPGSRQRLFLRRRRSTQVSFSTLPSP